MRIYQARRFGRQPQIPPQPQAPRGRFGLAAVAMLLVVMSGCASHVDRAVAVRQSFYQGNVQAALAQTDLEGKKRAHDGDVTQLNRAMIQLSAGEPAQAEQLLRQVRDRFDHFEQKSVAEQAAAMFSDDRRISYSGEEYEKILIRVMLAVSNLMHGGQDAHAYTLQIAAKQQQLLQTSSNLAGVPATMASPATPADTPPKVDLSPLAGQLAIGSYLRAAVLESSPLDFDDVQRCRIQVANWQPDFRDGAIDLARAETGRHSPPGHGVVYVLSLVGEGPYKEEETAVATTVSLLIADRILSAIGKHELPPNIAPVRIPVVVRAPQRVNHIEVSQQGRAIGSTATLMDVAGLAVEQNRLQKNEVIARAVARRIVKKGTVYAVKEGLGTQGSPELDLLLTVAGVVWEATERADTRCWSLLPDRIQVLRLELPAGPQSLTLTPNLRTGRSGQAETVAVQVQDGKSCFVLANFPSDRLVGKIQVSDPR